MRRPGPGVITFFTADGRHTFQACNTCAVDAVVNCAPGVRVRYRATTTHAEISRGPLGGAA